MAEFSMVFRGFNCRQVDEVVAQVEGTLGRGPLTGRPIDLKRLGWVQFDVSLRGYDRFEVEGAMRRYRRELAAHEGVECGEDDEERDSGLSLVLGHADGGAAPHHALVDRIRAEHDFPVALRGYDRGQVERFIARVWVTLGRAAAHGASAEPAEHGPEVTRQELNRPPLDVVIRGYDMPAVDRALGLYLREFLELRDDRRL